MRTATRLVSLFLVMILVNGSGAQAPQAKEPADEPEMKLPALLSTKPLKESPADDDRMQLLKFRYNEADGEAKSCYQEFLQGRGNLDNLYGACQRLVQAGLDLCDKPNEKLTLLTRYLELTREAETVVQTRYDAGRVGGPDLHRARYERLDAAIQLLRAKRAADKARDR